MGLKRIVYADLKPKQQEIYNFQKVAALLADYGFNCIKLADDWQGADFLAYHIDGETTLKVQLKGRLTIATKYEGKNLHIIFPENDDRDDWNDRCWYLVPHEELKRIVGETTGWLTTSSWTKEKGGEYHSANPSKALLNALGDYKLDPKAK